MQRHIRTKLLGDYGEAVSGMLLAASGFTSVRDLNRDRMNHPYGDYYAEKDGTAYIISVRTRNRLQKNGRLNSAYNFRSKTADVAAIAASLQAVPAWIAIQADAKVQCYCAYFGAMTDLNARGERYSIPMTPTATERYICLAQNRYDSRIQPQWDNGLD